AVRTKRRTPVLVALASAAGILLAGVTIIRVSTDTGELVIKSSDPGIEITVKRNGKAVEELTLKQGDNRMSVYSGDVEVVIKGANADAYEIKNNRITVRRGDRPVVEIEHKLAALGG